MAKVRTNVIVQGLSGSLGRDVMFRRLGDGRTILCVKPDFSRRVLSDEQQAHHRRFCEAAAYARAAAKTEPLYAELAAGTLKTAYNLALADWFHAPEILELDASAWHGEAGQVIRIKAVDDVQVTQVTVVITDSAGAVIEQGQATRADKLWWTYTTTAAAPDKPRMVATARDMPGHIAELHWQEPTSG